MKEVKTTSLNVRIPFKDRHSYQRLVFKLDFDTMTNNKLKRRSFNFSDKKRR